MAERQTAETQMLIGKQTDAGRSGKHNEDALDVFVVDWQDDIKLQQVQVAVVADGIGGNNAGERASRIAVERIRSVMTRERSLPPRQRLEQALIAANQEIFTTSQYEPNLRGMGTTVVVAAIAGSTLYLAHAGDSRAYLIRNGQIHQLTVDHTWAQEAIEAGRLTPESARLHPNRNVIKRFLGIEETVSVDHGVVDPAAPADPENPYAVVASAEHLDLKSGDLVLLCSDGLSDELSDDEILVGARKGPPQKAAEQLVAMANAKGGKDNITVVLLQLPGAPAAAAAAATAGKGKQRLLVGALAALALAVIAGVAVLALTGGKEEAAASATATPAASLVAVAPATSTPLQPTPAVSVATAAPLTATPVAPPSPSAETTVNSLGQAGSSAAATPTPFETSTPLPLTLTPTAAPSPTRSQSTPAPTSPAQTTPTASLVSGDVSVVLISPRPDESVQGEMIFKWNLQGRELGSDEALELVFWRPEENPMTDGRAPVDLELYRPKSEVSVDLSKVAGLTPGSKYMWGVLLVKFRPGYERIRQVGESQTLFYKGSGQNGSSPDEGS